MPTVIPKFKEGDLVDVAEYYNDMIVKSVYRGLVLGYKIHTFEHYNTDPTIIYDLLCVEGDKAGSVQKAEETAILLVGEGES